MDPVQPPQDGDRVKEEMRRIAQAESGMDTAPLLPAEKPLRAGYRVGRGKGTEDVVIRRVGWISCAYGPWSARRRVRAGRGRGGRGSAGRGAGRGRRTS